MADITEAAGLTRTAFYRHFGDRQDLLVALLAEIGSELDRADAAWVSAADDPSAGLPPALSALTAMFADHGRLMQAIVDASADDDELRDLYGELAERFVASATARIERDVEAA